MPKMTPRVNEDPKALAAAGQDISVSQNPRAPAACVAPMPAMTPNIPPTPARSRASTTKFIRQAEQFGRSQPRRSELRTPALSVTFNDPTRLPPEMVREVGQYGWELAGPSAYPLVMAFDADNVARPLSERDCELAAACCLVVGRLVARLAADSRIDPASAREAIVVETLPDKPSVAVALPLLDISRPRDPHDSSLPS